MEELPSNKCSIDDVICYQEEETHTAVTQDVAEVELDTNELVLQEEIKAEGEEEILDANHPTSLTFTYTFINNIKLNESTLIKDSIERSG